MASLATPRKFTISLETALILSIVVPVDEFKDDIVLRYDGRKPLKGVLGGKPYPIFWIDAHLGHNTLSELEDELVDAKKPNEAAIRKFCFEFIDQYDSYLFRPFIKGCPEASLRLPPPNYEEHLRQLDRKWREEMQKLENEQSAIRGNDIEDGVEKVELAEDDPFDFLK